MLQRNVDVVLLSNSVSGVKTAGPYRLATELRDASYSCQVIDHILSLTDEDLSKALDIAVGSNTKILGISTTFIVGKIPSEESSNLISERFLSLPISRLKKRYPQIKVVIGGAFADPLIKQIGSTVDVVMLGLSESILINYLRDTVGAWTSKSIINASFHPSKIDFNYSQIKYHRADNVCIGEVLPIEIGRGCIFKCKFCAYPLNGKKMNDYVKHSTVLREEFIRNYQEYGITKYLYMDDTHNDTIDKLQQMADIAQSLPFKLEYTAYLRLDLLRAHPEQYQLLIDGGLRSCFFGIETLNYEAAKIIGKGLHPDKVIEELHNFSQKMPDVITQGGFICGLPKETKQSITEWTNLINEKTFPLDSIRMSTLFMVNGADNKKTVISEFSKNAKEWYTWDKGNWSNGEFDLVWAEEFVREFSKKLVHRNRVPAWDVLQMQHLGISVARSSLFVDVEQQWGQKIASYVSSYKDCLFSGK